MGVGIPIYLFLPWDKMFFDHLLARVPDFGIIDATVPVNWNGGSVERAAEGSHNDKDVSLMWIWYIPSRALLLYFLLL